MPYFTNKGTGKDKGKTCVYKKEDRTKVGCTDGPIEKYMAALHINENDELDWIRLVEPDFNATTLRYGQIFKNKWGDYIRTIMFIGQDDEEVSYEKPMTLLTFKIVDDPSGYKAYPDFPKDHELNSELSLNPKDFDEGIKSGSYKPMFTDKEFKLKESSDFDWIKDVETTPNYQGHPQGVVYLRTHGEITEFFDLIGGTYGIIGKRKIDIENTKRDFHNALDETMDRFESDEWDGYDDWVPVISASFFISKKDPTKYITGYWDLDVDEESVDDWIKGDCEDESIDCDNWRLYKDISELKELFNYYYTPQSLHKTKSGKPIKVGDKVKVIDPNVESYGEVLKVENLVGGDGYEKNGGAFQTVEYDTLYFAGHEVEHVENLNESETNEFDWIRDIEIDLVPGQIYDIQTGNGHYWVPEKFVGRKWDDEYDVEVYKFKDLTGSGSSGSRSINYVKDLMEKGYIREYDPNWSIKNEITFSDNIGDTLKGGFVIYFKDGVYLDQTLSIQDKLFEMGFSFYTKGPNEYITNEDSPKKIQFFECFNWDVSNPRYKKMPSNQRDQKKILLSSVKDDSSRWMPKPSPRYDDQELFSTVVDHDVIVINGDKYITNDINESDDFDWVREIPGTIEYGQDYRYFEINVCYNAFYNDDTGEDDCAEGGSYFFKIPKSVVPKIWGYQAEDEYFAGPGDEGEAVIEWAIENTSINDDNIDMFEYVTEHDKETWCTVWGNYRDKKECFEFINESDGFDWVRRQEPEKEIRKSKKYVVDVSHLRATPMKHSHDPTLTKQDVLKKLEGLGYDVEHIDIDRAKYFYIEPTEPGSPSWQYNEYGIPIEYNYWVDYVQDLLNDPSYGGKYQLIGVDELMFLIDNNLINESNDFGWLDMGEPLSICDATTVLKPGDVVMVNELKPMDGNITVKNVTAEVLAVDDCNKIQPENLSKLKTILIHVNEEYDGFDVYWISSFRDEYKNKCLDGRCMFLLCDGNQGNIMVTKMGGGLFGESEDNDLDRVLSKIHSKKDIIVGNKETISEVAGISFEARKWSEIVKKEINSNQSEERRIIIDGYDHPEAFNTFPIDYLIIDFYDKLTGYSQDYSGYDKDGNYIVLLYIQPQFRGNQGGYTLSSVLNHELKHAWQDYNRLSKGLPSIDDTKESKELYNRDFILMLSDSRVGGPIKEILKYYYYLSKLETSAYLENVYDKNISYESTVRGITSKDFESFKDRFDLDVNWHLMNTAYDIPFLKKFKSPIDFIDYSAEELRSRSLKMVKKINKMKYVHGKM